MVAADRAKFEVSAAVPVCALAAIDVLVTDAAPPGLAAEALARGVVELVVADPG
jgi:DeoR/GlpR family transcriptional regulator of sugar metabolism